jgi:asparagine synthase (glutamine-hydrolysing)|tara:strand:- start:1272 stop:3104 length:1833 start_codon:yes stop_codon:yes gene_type:complete
MCGILAYISSKEIDQNKILNIKNLMKCRGPDDQSYKKVFFGKKNLHLFHSRLSIQDLNKRSNQPYIFKDYILIFNGEIYNFKELKKNVNKKFQTLSDTEVILYYYDLYKERCFNLFEGMWSIVIYDIKHAKIIASRDRFGEKPLFFFKKNEEIILASQVSYINQILQSNPKFNSKKINSFLQFGYKSLFKNEETFFKNINHIEKSTITTIEKNLKVTKKKYWKLNVDKKIENLSLNDHISNTKKLLINAIDLRLVSDVPIALNLSGGIDSGAICSIASKILGKKLETFSIIDSDPRYNEGNLIKATAKDCGVKTNLIKLNKNIDFFDILKKSTEYNHYPIFTITNLIQYYLSSFVKKRGFKVSLSGAGADEIYGGYYDHYLMILNKLKQQKNSKYSEYLKIWKKNIKENLRNPFFKKHNLFRNDENFRGYIYDNFKNNRNYCLKKLEYNFTEKKFFNELLKNRMANELFHENVPIFMHSEDLNSMQFSIENRSPFLDTKLIEYLFSVKSEHLLNQCQNKFILRSSLIGILNNKVLNQKMKSGFNASILSLFNFKSGEIQEFINNDSLIYDFVDKTKIKNLIKNEKLMQKNSYSKFLFTFLSLKVFLDRFA